ncbi:hypothetical protein RDWZM_004354 [Blomia tropicalis]|uniref:Golgi apparatus protein 1 n=1 Tax=Blomia tropicalis TaxID=40697 RepID=A0A9Q0MHA6_BLOTA|nr:hypothetical protein RDWZM_004354 [Blomia tropicalis]
MNILYMFFVILLFEINANGQVYGKTISNQHHNNLSNIRDLFQNITILQSSNDECKNELTKLCGIDSGALDNNLAIINCLSDHEINDDSHKTKLSSSCQHQIWSYKNNITNADYFTTITKTICKTLLLTNNDCLEAEHEDVLSPGANILSCLLERLQPNTATYGCRTYLKEMEKIIFSDYRLIHRFANVCQSHIIEFKCGRLEPNQFNMADDDNEEKAQIFNSQTNTIECLQEHIDKLSPQCSHEIFRISELQSDDFHLDKPLYFKCRSDRETFCKNVQSGNGKVYKCLMQHKDDEQMTEECREKLTQRELLIVQDYRVSKSLVQSCKGDIKRYQCREGTSDRREIRLAQILICLESAYTKNLPITPPCYGEMLLHRRNLFDEYKLTPNLVQSCQHDIDEFCPDLGSVGGKIIHCLMKYSKPKRRRGDALNHKRISSKCQQEVEQLLKEVNIAENWRVDPVLHDACQSSVELFCHNIKSGNGRILDCLTDHIDSSQMGDECRQSLLLIQYFMARNFELDTSIYEACHIDAGKYCNAGSDWHHTKDHDNDDNEDHKNNEDEANEDDGQKSTVMACLYRLVYHDETNLLNQNCVHQVKRIMSQRSDKLSLLPFVEIECNQALGKYCSDQIGHEMECLQDNYQNLDQSCRNMIGNFTIAQGSHFELNHPLLRHCSTIAKDLCPQEYESYYDDDRGEVIDCLIRHKNTFHMKTNRKCRAALEHYQLINLKDYRFDSKFKEACRLDVINHCSMVRTKNEVINCLSTLVYNDTINNVKRRVSKECKNLLRVELLQMNENIDLDPTLVESCRYDRQHFCKDVDSGESHVIECLMANMMKLKKSCQRQLFHRQYIELVDNSVDYSLLSICKHAIEKYCASSDLHDVIYCLRDHRKERGLGGNCRSLILKRLLQQNKDYRLNPRLKQGCNSEIKKYCSDIILKSKPDELLDGKIGLCLKKKYLVNLLSEPCEIEIVNLIREVSSDIELDPILARNCKLEINRCTNDDLNHGDIQECLKNRFMLKKIEDLSCRREVARIIRETESDIESDPHLHRMCLNDLKTFCSDVIPGGGQQLNCLTAIQRISSRKLSPECDTILLKRLQLFEYAAEVYPSDSVAKVIQIVANSPVHNSVYSVLASFLFFIFIIGLFCGRYSKNVATSDKIK